MAFKEDPDPDTASLTDRVADAVATGDLAAIRHVYEDDDVRVPDKVFDARFEVVHPLA
jgi:hypothetical protein